MIRATVLLLCLSGPVLACKCLMSLNACHEAATSGMVFAGTVESIEPNFLRDWNPNERAGLLSLMQEDARARAERTSAAFARLKTVYREMFPDITDDRKQKLEAARTPDELGRLFFGILDGGMRVRFHIHESFKKSGDDDDKDEDKPASNTVEVWTPFGDCGFAFQIGETYLVYADDDEETGTLSTGTCSRTRRLTDAGEDLAYLFLQKLGAGKTSRLEGFVTGDSFYQTAIDKLHDPSDVKSPVASVLVALESGAERRMATTGLDGRFVFDGLTKGTYSVTVYKVDYPKDKQPLSPTRQVAVEEKSCVLEMLLVK